MTGHVSAAQRPAQPDQAGPGAVFYIFAVALFCSRVGTLSVSFCLPWILYGKTSPFVISLVSASAIFPYVFSPWLSRLPDRYDFRWLLLVFELMQAPVTIGAYFLVMRNVIGLLVVCLLISATAEAVSGLITDFYLIPHIAPAGSLSRANGIAVSATSAAPLASPLLAGLLVAAHATIFIFLLNAVTYTFTAAMAVVFARRRSAPRRSPPTPTLSAIKKLIGQKSILRLTLSLALYNLGTGAVLLLITLKAQHIWHWGATGIGAVTTIVALAGAGTAWASGRYQRDHFRAYRAGIAICTVGTLAVTTNSILWLNIAGLAVLNLGEGPVVVAQQTIRQTTIPQSVYGVVNGCIRAVLIAAVPAARLILGGMTAITSLTTAGIPLALIAIIALLISIRNEEDKGGHERTGAL